MRGEMNLGCNITRRGLQAHAAGIFLISALAACAVTRPSDAARLPQEQVLMRAARLNWTVRVLDRDTVRAEGRVHVLDTRRFRVGAAEVAASEVALILRRDQARALRDWKVFAAGAGVGGLAGLFAGQVYTGVTDQVYGGSESTRWFVGGALTGVLTVLVLGSIGGGENWVQEWP
jgi:hypothetical protein